MIGDLLFQPVSAQVVERIPIFVDLEQSQEKSFPKKVDFPDHVFEDDVFSAHFCSFDQVFTIFLNAIVETAESPGHLSAEIQKITSIYFFNLLLSLFLPIELMYAAETLFLQLKVISTVAVPSDYI